MLQKSEFVRHFSPGDYKHVTQINPDDFGEHLAVLEAITLMFEKPFLSDRTKDVWYNPTSAVSRRSF